MSRKTGETWGTPVVLRIEWTWATSAALTTVRHERLVPGVPYQAVKVN